MARKGSLKLPDDGLPELRYADWPGRRHTAIGTSAKSSARRFGEPSLRPPVFPGSPGSPWSDLSVGLGLALPIPCGQRQTSGKYGKTENRWLAKLAVDHGKKARAEKQKRKQIAAPDGLYAEPSNSPDQSTTPEKIRQPEQPTAFQKHPRPLAFGENKHAVSGQKLRTRVRADTKSVAKPRRVSKDEEAFLKVRKQPRDHSSRDRLFRRFRHLTKSGGQNAETFSENRSPGDNKTQDEGRNQHLAEAIHNVRPQNDNQ